MIKFKDTYFGSRVLITGHTGFKGSWLALWLNELGAEVYGISNGFPSKLNHFDVANLSSIVKDNKIDIIDYEEISKSLSIIKPDFIFHLAAQPIVSESYKNPYKTYETNLMGTLSILEAIREIKLNTIAVFITSDKCYENVEWPWGYKETDRLGGADPYSSSKACAEIAISAYFRSYFNNNSPVKIGIGRAGNVIGGGDWAPNRVVPDCMRSWSENNSPNIRNPYSTRPWQHVLEPLSGYLLLGQSLINKNSLNGEAFNFGPPSCNNYSVIKLVKELSKFWPNSKLNDYCNTEEDCKESNLLKLNCDKALFYMDWKSTLTFDETVRLTSNWYYQYYSRKDDQTIYDLTMSQIMEYISLAKSRKIDWSL